ncbi:hypothetical protein GUITHDRAFT_111078 [Guillardia theta CCMP2712]|uniref:Uncharacterized protein n=1 Tax=Guillardia theta (strain CCMP2712) TaxID=905079 RepID=L1J4L8_GUITC|nr:hypothetical protein GUITHDRAFT_111078 [Guillardia theta CCMP2712]EKX43035.1 hypothetical protein GUITHDRAFT_111078 [Guillardia theta CCMP2712]|eukprot:XP_005830015.1 hypothetical protein GUITHDRAFT_111078 [Guillardia theta CCMP2712]
MAGAEAEAEQEVEGMQKEQRDMKMVVGSIPVLKEEREGQGRSSLSGTPRDNWKHLDWVRLAHCICSDQIKLLIQSAERAVEREASGGEYTNQLKIFTTMTELFNDPSFKPRNPFQDPRINHLDPSSRSSDERRSVRYIKSKYQDLKRKLYDAREHHQQAGEDKDFFPFCVDRKEDGKAFGKPKPFVYYFHMLCEGHGDVCQLIDSCSGADSSIRGNSQGSMPGETPLVDKDGQMDDARHVRPTPSRLKFQGSTSVSEGVKRKADEMLESVGHVVQKFAERLNTATEEMSDLEQSRLELTRMQLLGSLRQQFREISAELRRTDISSEEREFWCGQLAIVKADIVKRTQT